MVYDVTARHYTTLHYIPVHYITIYNDYITLST